MFPETFSFDIIYYFLFVDLHFKCVFTFDVKCVTFLKCVFIILSVIL